MNVLNGFRSLFSSNPSSSEAYRPPASHALGMNRRNVCVVHPGNPRSKRQWADDKALTKARLIANDVPVPPTFAVVASVGEIADAWMTMRELDAFVVKPTGGRAGNGILVLERTETDDGDVHWQTPSGRRVDASHVQRHMADLVSGAASTNGWGRALVEYRVEADTTFRRIYPHGLPDVRVIVHRGQNLLAMARIPTDESDGRANLHQGALGVGIDLDTGTMDRAYNYKGYLDAHPDTGAPIAGTTIPHWDAILDVCARTARAVPLEYLGVDLVIDADRGPLVMEINARPGLEIQNVTRQGLRSRLADA